MLAGLSWDRTAVWSRWPPIRLGARMNAREPIMAIEAGGIDDLRGSFPSGCGMRVALNALRTLPGFGRETRGGCPHCRVFLFPVVPIHTCRPSVSCPSLMSDYGDGRVGVGLSLQCRRVVDNSRAKVRLERSSKLCRVAPDRSSWDVLLERQGEECSSREEGWCPGSSTAPACLPIAAI